jgi:sucrose phosphorylase
LIRSNEEIGESILFVVNVTSHKVELNIDFKGTNVLDNSNFNGIKTLNPYEFVWIKRRDKI